MYFNAVFPRPKNYYKGIDKLTKIVFVEFELLLLLAISRKWKEL